MTVTLIGNYLSPYVHKVLVCLDMKGIEYEIDPIIPFYGNDDFTALNPDRRIPVLLHDDLVLTESSVICEYLDELHPRPSLLPDDPRHRARARALQAFADGRIGDVLIWQLFNEQVIKRFVWEQPVDQALLDRTLGEDIPQHREALREAGAPISTQTWGTATPRLNSQRPRRETSKES